MGSAYPSPQRTYLPLLWPSIALQPSASPCEPIQHSKQTMSVCSDDGDCENYGYGWSDGWFTPDIAVRAELFHARCSWCDARLGCGVEESACPCNNEAHATVTPEVLQVCNELTDTSLQHHEIEELDTEVVLTLRRYYRGWWQQHVQTSE